MRESSKWRRYLRLWGPDPAADVDDELSFHLEMRVRDLVARGRTEAEAWAEARRAFGDVEGIRSQLRRIGRHRARRYRRTRIVSDLRSDLRVAFRAMRRQPAFAVGVIATLALAIGATAAVFSLVDGVLLRPLPYPAPDRLAVVWERNVPRDRGENVVSVPNYEAWRQRSRSFASLAALVPDTRTLCAGGPERVPGALVTAGWFDVVGVAPARGRGFTEAEQVAETRVVVLSDGLWRERYGADPEILGRSIELGRETFIVTGIMPAGFEPPAYGWLGSEQRYWAPFTPTPSNREWGRFLLVLGRLRSGVTLAQADGEMAAIAERLGREDRRNEGWTADVVGLHDQVTGEVRVALLVLLTAVGFLLAIAVANVTNLVLARAQARGQEFAVRAALGAGRGRMVRQLLAEGLGLATVAAPIGIALAYVGVDALVGVLPAELPRVAAVRLDFAGLLLAIAAALIASLAIGILPALRVARNTAARLRAAAGGRIAGAGGGGLVVAEVALALVLTVGAGLAMRSFANLRAVELGFDAGGVTAFRVSLPPGEYDDPGRRRFFDDLLDRIRALPGVEAAGAISIRPLGGAGPATSVHAEDRPDEAGTAPVADLRVATGDYFGALGIPLRSGRLFDGRESPDGPAPIVVNRTMAELLWPDRDPVGRRPVFQGMTVTGVVIGVVDDVRLSGPATAVRPTVYFPQSLWANGDMDVLVRAAAPSDVLIPMLRRTVWSLDSTLPLYRIERLDAAVAASVARDRVTFILLAAFAVVALLLAATGIYSVLAVEIGRRRRSLAIRMALGARAGHVRAGVVRSAMRLGVAGCVVGAVGAIALTRFMGSLLFGVKPTDGATFAGVVLLLLALTLVAAYLPARRATRVDPLEVMRAE